MGAPVEAHYGRHRCLWVVARRRNLMSPILILVVLVVVVVGGLAIRSDWNRRHMRGLSNGPGAHSVPGRMLRPAPTSRGPALATRVPVEPD